MGFKINVKTWEKMPLFTTARITKQERPVPEHQKAL